MDAGKSLYAYDYVDLKDREYGKKHTRQRHLGDIDSKHRYRPRSSTTKVINSLVSLDFPETRAINTTTAGRIISNQRKQIRNTYKRTQWKETLNGWSRPSTATTTDGRVKPPAEPDNNRERPQTSVGVSIPDGGRQLQMNPLTVRPFSTGALRRPSRKPPQASGFMWVRMNRNGSSRSSIQLRRITDEIRLQWEEEDKKERLDNHRKERDQSVGRGRASTGRSGAFNGQWLSFAAGGMGEEGQAREEGGGGVVEAFTGESNPAYYSIDGRIGANVATQLRGGNKIRIGVNGNIRSDSLRVRQSRKDEERAEGSFSRISQELERLGKPLSWSDKSNAAAKAIIPLCWDEQLHSPDVKVVEVKEKLPDPGKPDPSERHPVVFEKLVKDDARPRCGPKLETYRLSHRKKIKRNLDGTESLSNRITVITMDQVDEDRQSPSLMDYEEILQRSLDAEPSNGDQRRRSSSANGSKLPTVVEKHETLRRSVHTAASASSDTGLPPYGAATKPRPVPLTSPVPSSPSIISGRPRTGSQRSQSGNSKGQHKYSFSQQATPRNLNSPHPNLAKPGHLPRTGISSINPGMQDGEHEYIRISQPILPGSPDRMLLTTPAVSGASDLADDNATDDDERSLGQNSSIDSFDSMDSMNVVGTRPGGNLPEDLSNPSCSCSPEAKRALSTAAALIHATHDTDIINIPTAVMSLSDLNSMSDVDRLASRCSFHGSLGSDIVREANDNVTINSDWESAAERSSGSTSPPRHEIFTDRLQEGLGYIVNQVDILDLAKTDAKRTGETDRREKLSSSGKKQNRTVTFAEEVANPFTPNCTPESTPREAAEWDSEQSDNVEVQT